MRRIWKEVLTSTFRAIKRMTYADAMEHYGSDRLDLRFDMKLSMCRPRHADRVQGLRAVEQGGIVAIRVPARR